MDDGSLGSADDTDEIISPPPPKSRTTPSLPPSPMPPNREQVGKYVFDPPKISKEGLPKILVQCLSSESFSHHILFSWSPAYPFAATPHVPTVPSSPSMYEQTIKHNKYWK